MKYFKKKDNYFNKNLIIVLSIFILSLLYINKDIIKRSLVTINLGSIYVELLNDKAELLNFLSGNNLREISISMSPNNYVKMQKERSSMVTNYIKTGKLWDGKNNFFNAKYLDTIGDVDAEIKLFGMNPDHFRDSDAHSFRLKFKNSNGFGKKKVNFINPRSRDYITDPLLNIIFSKLYSGIQIRYEPVNVKLNKANYGIFLKEDFFDKYLIEENRRRESVIFEIIEDSLYPNYYGEKKEFLNLINLLQLNYQNNYSSFLEKFDYDKLKGIITLALVINDSHPLSNINMHWYYNPVNGKIEPTIREGFVKRLDKIEINELLSNNKIILDIYKKKIESNFFDDLNYNLFKIKDIIQNDSTYNSFKQKMIGYNKQISKKENIILDNIAVIEDLIKSKSKHNTNNNIFIKKILNDTVITGNFKVQKNQKLIIKSGVEITLKNAYLEIFGGFEAIGKINEKIIIKGEEQSGTIFFNSTQPILIDNVTFNNLTNNKSKHIQPSSITFYECNSIQISNSDFVSNLKGDDYLNFFRSENIFLDNLSFKDILYDAIDSDFSNLEVINSRFENIGNDAIDGSGSTISIKNNYFKSVMDKAISAGENSLFQISNSNFMSNEIAIVGKDGSTIISNNNLLKDNKLDIASFIKKKNYSSPFLTFNGTNISKYLIEQGSIVKGIDSIQFSFEVESKLYGNLYGTASER